MATTTATSVHDLIERVQRYNPGAQVDLIRKAYDFSENPTCSTRWPSPRSWRP